MPIRLKNKLIELFVDLPEENYQSSRFDRTGKIVSLKFDAILLTASEKKSSKNSTRYGQGFYNEFGIAHPLGFDEALEGDWFHKIGVGLLKKEGKQYDFNKFYEIRPAAFKITQSTNKIIFSCTAQNSNGYAYVLTKEIVLLSNGFKIIYHLKNTGTKVIETNEYCHNFLSIEGASLDRYELKFPFLLESTHFNEIVNPKNLISIKKNKISMLKGLQETFFFSNLSGSKSVSSGWVLQDKVKKICISEQGDFKTSQVNLWGEAHVVSPELFVAINVAPQKHFSWQRTYSIHTL